MFFFQCPETGTEVIQKDPIIGLFANVPIHGQTFFHKSFTVHKLAKCLVRELARP